MPGLAPVFLHGSSTPEKITNKRLLADAEFLGQGVVRAEDQAAVLDELFDQRAAFRTHLEVVIDLLCRNLLDFVV